MDHPYSGSAGYIYANDHPAPYRPTLVQVSQAAPTSPPKQNGSSTPTHSISAKPRTSHDSSWSTEGTYTRVQRPKHVDAAPIPVPIGRPRGHSQSSGPLLPLRGPISHPYQQRNTSWVEPEHDDAVEAQETVGPASSVSFGVQPRAIAPSTTRRAPMMTPYATDGDPMSLRRSAFVPHDLGPSDRTVISDWQDTLEQGQRRIQRAIRRLRRWTCTVIPD
ncbi:hypothetical protein FB45DRAFT_222140 [Roridomyces roridus]|uniref:Uncharacterized protein n=1 Tax=Roridomyces roridus TaxID=1738132 RepID=A0AAD7F6K8_9AGAR|nr:hypothetical protein FB45DRAFT_524964 [Roridomyces roridus]KAJ7617061.1 hypothetical protein FB45DRAFT_222140 [Roridomyces roridus]